MTISQTAAVGEMTINNEQLRSENDVLKTDNAQLRINNETMKDEIGQLRTKIDIIQAENNWLKIEDVDMEECVGTSKLQPSAGVKHVHKLKVSKWSWIT